MSDNLAAEARAAIRRIHPAPDWDAEFAAAEPPPDDYGLPDDGAPPPEGEPTEDTAAEDTLYTRGDTFLREVAALPEPIWGSGSDVLASRGEPCLITGPIGAGKTSVNAGLVRGSVGMIASFLGYPIEPCDRVLYLACDRPRQIARNLRRTIDPDYPHLGDRLVFWKGPPPRDIAQNPHVLLRMAERAGLKPGDRVFIDGIKDIAARIADEETGGGLNRAFQLLVAQDIDLFANHHQRKAQAGKNGGKPRALSDVYGSTWITAGAGTVLLLWADQPGASFVELETLKPAGEHVGPLTVRHDLDTGYMTVVDHVTAEDVLRAAPGWHPLTRVIAEMGLDSGDKNGREKVRRHLRKLESEGRVESKKVPNDDGGKPSDYYLWVRS